MSKKEQQKIEKLNQELNNVKENIVVLKKFLLELDSFSAKAKEDKTLEKLDSLLTNL